MKKILNHIVCAALVYLAAGCSYIDDPLVERLNGVNARIEALRSRIDAQNSQVTALAELLGGNVITGMEEISGKYVISYLDSKNVEKTVELATEDQMINAPILGVRKDDKGVYYWTVTVDKVTTDLKDGSGNPIPVAGKAPLLSVNKDGCWTVNGTVITYPDGSPVIADDGSSAAIKAVKKDAAGNLLLTLGGGQTVTIPMQKALNLKLDCEVRNMVVDLSREYEIKYEVEGISAATAIVDIADVQSLGATINKSSGKVAVSFPSDFESGRLVLFAYDLTNTVIRPIFFEKAAESRITVKDAAGLMTVASRVNALDGAEKMEIILDADIDLGGAEWTPIGNGTATTAGVVTGAAFKGIFRGQGHTVDNFKVKVPSGAADGTAAGLFGILDKASVIGVNIGSKAELSAASAKTAHCGLVAGFAINSTIENCRNAGTVSVTAVTDNVRESAAGIVGSLYTSEDSESVVKNCTNDGAVTSANTINTKNGSTGLSVAGIAGYVDGKAYNLIQNCTNNAAISGQATRMAGICATANTYAKVDKCINNGTVTCNDIKASNSRVAGICSAASTETYFTQCINMGAITYSVAGNTTQGYAAGILGQSNNSLTIDGCENYGTILSDMFKGSPKYMGIIAGNFNSKAVTAKNNKLGGKIGPFTEDETYQVVTLTQDNYASYLTLATTKAESATLENNSFAGNGPVGILSVDDLKEFRDSVNAGKTYGKFTSKDGSVKLLADLDLSSETTWKPIGVASSLDLSQNYVVTYSGNVFSGIFDGNGHIITGFAPTVDIAAGSSFGLFGVIAGATVKNLTIGAPGDTAYVKLSSEGLAAAAVFAGTVINSSIIDCVNYAPFKFSGSRTDNKRVCAGIFAGMVNSSNGKCSGLSGLVNNADAVVKSGSNTKNGGTGVHFGGIAGFATGTQNSKTDMNTIENCVNHGNITSTVARSSGIVAASNANTCLRYCVNRGSQVNDFANGRIANITCVIGVNGIIDDCTNYGNVTTSDANTTAGGIVALFNHISVVMTGGANYGTIISANTQYHGLLAANLGTFASIDGFYVDGACGTYKADGKHEMHTLDKTTFMSHIGCKGGSTDMSKITNLSSKWGDAPTGDLPDLKDASLRILFIGNSFTKDAVEHIPGMLGAASISDITLAHCYYGGRTIPEYNNGWTSVSDYTLYYKNPGESSWTTHSGKVNLKKVAESGRWDIITIQEHTGNYVAWGNTIWSQSEKTAVQGLLDKCVATQTTAPKTYYILSQVYFNMAKIGSASQPHITWTDQAGMYDVVVARGRKVKDETTVTDILSTCTYLQNLRTSKIDNTMNLTRDGYHMDYGIARYGAACLIFESLITPTFKVNLDGNTYRYTNSSTSEGSYSTPTTDQNIPYALNAARYAMDKPFEITDMSKE